MLEQVYPQKLQPMEGTHAGAGEKCEEEEEEVVKRNFFVFISHFPTLFLIDNILNFPQLSLFWP